MLIKSIKEYFMTMPKRSGYFSLSSPNWLLSIKSSTKKSIIEGIQDGTINIIISTHAILQKNIIFHKYINGIWV